MSHGTAGDRGSRGGCPLKACPVRKYGIRMGKRKSRRRTRPQACAADSETGIPEEQRHLSRELMFFWKPASLDVGNSRRLLGQADRVRFLPLREGCRGFQAAARQEDDPGLYAGQEDQEPRGYGSAEAPLRTGVTVEGGGYHLERQAVRMRNRTMTQKNN